MLASIKGTRELFVSIKKQGFDKVRVDNEIIDIVDGFELDRYKIHNIEILIDNFTLRDDNNSDERLKNSLNITFSNGDGSVLIIDENNNLSYYSKNLICPDSGISYKMPEPNSFSFNFWNPLIVKNLSVLSHIGPTNS